MKPIRVPRPRPRTTRPIGRTVPLHPQRAAQDSRPDGSSGRRAALDSGGDLGDRPRQRETVRRWLSVLAEGVEGLRMSHPGAPRKVIGKYRKKLVHAVRSSHGTGTAVLLVDLTASGRLHGRANRNPGDLRECASAPEARNRPQPPPAHHHSPDPSMTQKKTIEGRGQGGTLAGNGGPRSGQGGRGRTGPTPNPKGTEWSGLPHGRGGPRRKAGGADAEARGTRGATWLGQPTPTKMMGRACGGRPRRRSTCRLTVRG